MGFSLFFSAFRGWRVRKRYQQIRRERKIALEIAQNKLARRVSRKRPCTSPQQLSVLSSRQSSFKELFGPSIPAGGPGQFPKRLRDMTGNQPPQTAPESYSRWSDSGVTAKADPLKLPLDTGPKVPGQNDPQGANNHRSVLLNPKFKCRLHIFLGYFPSCGCEYILVIFSRVM